MDCLHVQLVVEYDQGGVDAFIAFADAFEEEFAGILVDGVQASCLLVGACRS